MSSSTPLTLKPATPTPAAKKAVPTRAQLAPWDFDYRSAPDGKDANLLIMFHGLGDTKAAFAGLGKQLNLPSTAVLSLQAPNVIPLLDGAYTWYNTFDPMFNPLPHPDPSPTLPALRKLLTTLITVLGWRAEQIHLFGWGQGGTMALELALAVGRTPLQFKLTVTEQSAQPKEVAVEAKRLGSAVSVCAGLESFPSAAIHAPTPVLWFMRSPKPQQETGLKRAFTTMEVAKGSGQGEDMPRGRPEWEPIMRFWGQVLARGDEGWKGDGEVYEVVKE